ncbi:MAG: hypothetical protein Tsb0016_12990 [Sphingomonadales bacterium]
MAQVTVDIGGYAYKLACRDGEEERLHRLAAYLNDKVAELTQALGQVAEGRMLLMAALMVTDELFEAREGAAPGNGDGAADARTQRLMSDAAAFLDQAADRAEALIEALETRMQNA